MQQFPVLWQIQEEFRLTHSACWVRFHLPIHPPFTLPSTWLFFHIPESLGAQTANAVPFCLMRSIFPSLDPVCDRAGRDVGNCHGLTLGPDETDLKLLGALDSDMARAPDNEKRVRGI